LLNSSRKEGDILTFFFLVGIAFLTRFSSTTSCSF